MFHANAQRASEQIPNAYISRDGHAYACPNPESGTATYHIIFSIDRSSSMRSTHCRPLNGTPVHTQISLAHDNCYGAVLDSLYAFWSARATPLARTGGKRHDSYSIILFNKYTRLVVENDVSMSPIQLLTACLQYGPSHGTDYSLGLDEAMRLMSAHWSNEKIPVVIFLSDGAPTCPPPDIYQRVERLAHRSNALGLPLQFHSVFFGARDQWGILKRMADVARESSTAANPQVACTYGNALDSVELSERFLGLAESMRKTRSSLIRM